MSKTETLTIRLDKGDKQMIAHYAKLHGLTMAELIKDTVLEKIEDEVDLEIYEKAIAEYNADPVSYSLEDTRKILGLE